MTGALPTLIVALLAVAAALSFAFGDWVEGLAVVIVILINAAIGFVTELRARIGSDATRLWPKRDYALSRWRIRWQTMPKLNLTQN